MGSQTGRGYTDGSDSYRSDDVAREERERRSAKPQPIAEPKFEGDPNFGDYNIPPGGNHP